FGIDMSRLHWDMTSISLFGDYDQPDEDYAQPRWGKPKDRRPDLKQIQAGLGVSGDGGIPVFHRAYDGGAGEVNQVVGAMATLQKMAGPRRFLLIGDSKLISYNNVQGVLRRRGALRRPGLQGLRARRRSGRPGRPGGHP